MPDHIVGSVISLLIHEARGVIHAGRYKRNEYPRQQKLPPLSIRLSVYTMEKSGQTLRIYGKKVDPGNFTVNLVFLHPFFDLRPLKGRIKV